MRLTSDVFCSALLRSVFADGGFAAIAKRGAGEAGSIYIIQRTRVGHLRLFGPAPQSVFMDGEDDGDALDGRRFECIMDGTSEVDINARLDRERRYDTDIWVVELETDALPHTVKVVQT
ncbi:MAG: DUF1491 family protein [Pseudomonadota bacterium]